MSVNLAPGTENLTLAYPWSESLATETVYFLQTTPGHPEGPRLVPGLGQECLADHLRLVHRLSHHR